MLESNHATEWHSIQLLVASRHEATVSLALTWCSCLDCRLYLNLNILYTTQSRSEWHNQSITQSFHQSLSKPVSALVVYWSKIILLGQAITQLVSQSMGHSLIWSVYKHVIGKLVSHFVRLSVCLSVSHSIQKSDKQSVHHLIQPISP